MNITAGLMPLILGHIGPRFPYPPGIPGISSKTLTTADSFPDFEIGEVIWHFCVVSRIIDENIELLLTKISIRCYQNL